MTVGTWVFSGVLLVLAALVAGAEATVVSLPYASLRALRDELGEKRGASIARYLNDPPLVLARLSDDVGGPVDLFDDACWIGRPLYVPGDANADDRCRATRRSTLEPSERVERVERVERRVEPRERPAAPSKARRARRSR